MYIFKITLFIGPSKEEMYWLTNCQIKNGSQDFHLILKQLEWTIQIKVSKLKLINGQMVKTGQKAQAIY